MITLSLSCSKSKRISLTKDLPVSEANIHLLLYDIESAHTHTSLAKLDNPFLTLQECKKRRKKLKSRRERSKHKVLLRLTHHKSQSTPQHVQQAAHQVGTGCCHGDSTML